MSVATIELGQVCRLDRRVTAASDALGKGLEFVGMEHVDPESGRIVLGQGSRTGEGRGQAFLFDARHVLFGKLRPYLRKIALPGQSGCASTELVPLLPDAARLDRGYLFHWVRRRPVIDALMAKNTGARMPRADMSVLLDMAIPLPPLDEQRRIVGLLDRAAEIRRRADAARAKARAIIPALFLDTFGDPATNPKGWKSVALDELCDLVRGSSPRPQGDPRFFGGPVPRLMISDITRDGAYVTPQTDSLTIEGANRSRPMKAGDVVMAVSGAVGLPAILTIDACIHDGFVGFRNLRGEITTQYFYYFLLAVRKTSQSQAVGATFQNLNTGQIRRWIVPIPPQKNQKVFTETANRLEAVARQFDNAAARAEAMAAGLSAKVFNSSKREVAEIKNGVMTPC